MNTVFCVLRFFFFLNGQISITWLLIPKESNVKLVKKRLNVGAQLSVLSQSSVAFVLNIKVPYQTVYVARCKLVIIKCYFKSYHLILAGKL